MAVSNKRASLLDYILKVQFQPFFLNVRLPVLFAIMKNTLAFYRMGTWNPCCNLPRPLWTCPKKLFVALINSASD